MKTFLTLCAILFLNVLFAQTSILLKDVSFHLGDTVKVCGRVFSSHYLPDTPGKPTLLNIGAEYPNQFLCVLIWGKDRRAMNIKPEKELEGKKLCIVGKVELYKSKLLIVVSDAEQLCCPCSD